MELISELLIGCFFIMDPMCMSLFAAVDHMHAAGSGRLARLLWLGSFSLFTLASSDAHFVADV